MALPVVAFTPPSDVAKASNGNLPDDLLVNVAFPARPTGARLHYSAARAWWALAAACLHATGVVLTVTSIADAYRNFARQLSGFLGKFEPCSMAAYYLTPKSKRRIFVYQGHKYWKLRAGVSIPSAAPGTSKHGLGCALDICELLTSGGLLYITRSKAWPWLLANLVSFGFSWEYPDLGVDDPHIRFIGGDTIPQRVLDYERNSDTSELPIFDPAAGKYGLWPLATMKPRLGVGAKGDVVRYLQAVIGATIDGDFGPRTRAAVIAFQTAEGITVDGWVGPQTWARVDRKAVSR